MGNCWISCQVMADMKKSLQRSHNYWSVCTTHCPKKEACVQKFKEWTHDYLEDCFCSKKYFGKSEKFEIPD